MCCIVANLLRIGIIIFSVLLLFLSAVQMLTDLSDLRQGNSVENHYSRVKIWTCHCFCGTLMTVLKLKDLCYLHWWQLMTSAFVISGVCVNYLLTDSNGSDLGKKVSNYFVLEYMLLTLLAVACYTRALRNQQEVIEN